VVRPLIIDLPLCRSAFVAEPRRTIFNNHRSDPIQTAIRLRFEQFPGFFEVLFAQLSGPPDASSVPCNFAEFF
jgi:hypothetical protein